MLAKKLGKNLVKVYRVLFKSRSKGSLFLTVGVLSISTLKVQRINKMKIKLSSSFLCNNKSNVKCKVSQVVNCNMKR